jgi:hypothetical protein
MNGNNKTMANKSNANSSSRSSKAFRSSSSNSKVRKGSSIYDDQQDPENKDEEDFESQLPTLGSSPFYNSACHKDNNVVVVNSSNNNNNNNKAKQQSFSIANTPLPHSHHSAKNR